LRIELLMTVLAGFAGGLAGTLWGGIVSYPLLARAAPSGPGHWLPESTPRLLLGAVVYGVCGAAAGFLFWLSWGLVALVATPWYVTGLLFGALLWAASALPALAVLSLRLREPSLALLVLAIEVLVASLAVGALCAYVWHRAT
jgi:hypothetical protein